MRVIIELNINEENINSENSKVDIVDFIYVKELPVETPVEKQKELGKNNWLYPMDNFEKWKKIAHYDINC